MLQLADIQAAAARLQGQVLDTPCVESRTLSQVTGAQVFLKMENLQFTASFKERGACNKLAQLSKEERARGVIAQHLKTQARDRTVMIVAPDGKGHVDISLRCPVGAPRPASAFARRYDGGGGRATAAGIDRLPITALENLLADFEAWLGP